MSRRRADSDVPYLRFYLGPHSPLYPSLATAHLDDVRRAHPQLLDARARAGAASRRDHPPRARAARPRPRVSLGRSPPRPRSSSRCVSPRARRAPGLDTLAAAPTSSSSSPTAGSAWYPILSVLGGFALAKAFVYWRVQFITASMIGKHVPRAHGRVLEYGVGQGRNLYYYPKNVGMVVGVDPDAKEDLLVQVSVAASVPFVSKAQPPSTLPANRTEPSTPSSPPARSDAWTTRGRSSARLDGCSNRVRRSCSSRIFRGDETNRSQR